MSVTNIVLPSKPKAVLEEEHKAQFEIDGLYPGYGHTLGNSLRRIILSSLPGAAITAVKIKGVDHEFSTIDGVKEDVITILLNLKNVRIHTNSEEPVTITLSKKGEGEVTAGDIDNGGNVEILNTDLVIANLTDKKAELDMEITVERGLGYVPKEVLQKEKVDIGTLALDAVFTPIRRVSYEVENMRVGDRTDYNRLRIFVETDGTVTPREALEQSIEIMINQLKAIVGFKEDEPVVEEAPVASEAPAKAAEDSEDETEYMKTRIESLDLGSRTMNALSAANIRTVGGLVRKAEADILEIEGLGDKGLKEIKKELKKMGVSLKE